MKHAPFPPLAEDRPWPTLPNDPKPKRWVVIVDGKSKTKSSSGDGR